MVKINFIVDGKTVTIDAKEGMTLLEVAEENNIPVSSPCGGNLACGQCHVVIDEAYFSKTGEVSEREQDVLDFVPNVTDTSRLACQVKISSELDGMKVTVVSL